MRLDHYCEDSLSGGRNPGVPHGQRCIQMSLDTALLLLGMNASAGWRSALRQQSEAKEAVGNMVKLTNTAHSQIQCNFKKYACNAGDAGNVGLILGSGRFPGGWHDNPL